MPSLGALDRTAGNLSRQVAEALREAVRKGDMRAGDLLPSSRSLAASLNVARGTVISAYEQLLVEGFLESKAGAGTHVAQALAKSHSFSTPDETLEPATKSALSERALAFARIAQEFRPLEPIPFAISVPVGST